MHTITVPTLAQSVLGRNKISAAQMASYVAFLDTELESGFAQAINALSQEDLERVAKFGYSAIPGGKDLDALFCAAWDKWVTTLDVAPPKSHKWIKGVLAAALILSYK